MSSSRGIRCSLRPISPSTIRAIVDENRQRKPSYFAWKEVNAPAHIEARWTKRACGDPTAFTNFPRLGDGVNFNIGTESSLVTANGIYTAFPFLPTPHAGRSPRHMDCGEGAVYPGVNPCGALIP